MTLPEQAGHEDRLNPSWGLIPTWRSSVNSVSESTRYPTRPSCGTLADRQSGFWPASSAWRRRQLSQVTDITVRARVALGTVGPEAGQTARGGEHLANISPGIGGNRSEPSGRQLQHLRALSGRFMPAAAPASRPVWPRQGGGHWCATSTAVAREPVKTGIREPPSARGSQLGPSPRAPDVFEPSVTLVPNGAPEGALDAFKTPKGAFVDVEGDLARRRAPLDGALLDASTTEDPHARRILSRSCLEASFGTPPRGSLSWSLGGGGPRSPCRCGREVPLTAVTTRLCRVGDVCHIMCATTTLLRRCRDARDERHADSTKWTSLSPLVQPPGTPSARQESHARMEPQLLRHAVTTAVSKSGQRGRLPQASTSTSCVTPPPRCCSNGRDGPWDVAQRLGHTDGGQLVTSL
jgi:hypothetical protein